MKKKRYLNQNLEEQRIESIRKSPKYSAHGHNQMHIMTTDYFFKIERIHGHDVEPNYGICLLACDSDYSNCKEILRIYNGGQIKLFKENIQPFQLIEET